MITLSGISQVLATTLPFNSYILIKLFIKLNKFILDIEDEGVEEDAQDDYLENFGVKF